MCFVSEFVCAATRVDVLHIIFKCINVCAVTSGDNLPLILMYINVCAIARGDILHIKLCLFTQLLENKCGRLLIKLKD